MSFRSLRTSRGVGTGPGPNASGAAGSEARSRRTRPWGFVAAAVAGLAVASACASDRPTVDQAAEAIHGHLESVAPHGLVGAWSDVRIEIVSLERVEGEPEGLSEATFRAYEAGTDGRGPTFRIVLAREGGAWVARRYGPALRTSVALMASRDRRVRYQDLVGSLRALQDTAALAFRAWSRPLKFAGRDHDDPARVAALHEELARGIPAEHLWEAVMRRGPGVPEEVPWGVTADPPTGAATVMWIADGKDDRVRCGQKIGSVAPGPEWRWLDGRFVTCVGRGARFVERTPPMDVLEEIELGEGVLRPLPAAPWETTEHAAADPRRGEPGQQ